MSTSTPSSSTSVVQEEGASSLNLLIPLVAGITAPPPTPMASMIPSHPPQDFTSGAPMPLDGICADDSEEMRLPGKPNNIASPPSKEDLDALALYLMQQSFHSTPHLLASPTLHRKRRSIPAAEARPDDDEIMRHTGLGDELDVSNGRNDSSIGELGQVYSYSDHGFCEESQRGIIEKACQEVGAFYISLQDADAALSMLRGRHGAPDNGSDVVEGGLISLSQILTSTSQHQQQGILDLDPLAFGAAADANFRDIMTRFTKKLFGISKDLLKLLLGNLPMEAQANIRGHFLKPLLYIHDNGKQELNPDDDDVVLSITHYVDNCECNKNALFLATLGTKLQTWSQGKYKAPILKSLCNNNSSGEVCIQFALTHHL